MWRPGSPGLPARQALACVKVCTVLLLFFQTSATSAKDHSLPVHVRRQLLEYQGGENSLLYANHVDHEDPEGRRVSLRYTAEQHPDVRLLSLDALEGLLSAFVAEGELKQANQSRRLLIRSGEV